MPLKWSVMNSRLPKQMVSPREKISHDKCSPSVAMVSADEGTIRMSRGKAHYKSAFLACQVSVVFAPAGYRVVKITRSYSEVVLRTTKHTSLSYFRPLLRDNSPMSNGSILKMNNGYCRRLIVRYLEKDRRACRSMRLILGEHEARGLDWFRPSRE
jgi:hypothetical protein